MAQNVVMKNSGIFSHPNVLSGGVPAGSQAESLNTVIDRQDITEQRRGFSQYGSPSLIPTKQLLQYKDVTLRHLGTDIQFDADFNGDYRSLFNPSNIPLEEVSTGVRMKFIETNGNLYLATKEGIKKVSARTRLDMLTSPVVNAGAPKGLDINVLLDFSQIGFVEPNSKVAYRVVFGYKDLNENLILGSPSAPTQVYNPSASSCFTQLRFSLPENITTSYFYQIYRTGLSTSDTPSEEPLDAGDEMNLVFEENITSTDITNGFIETTDITPEPFRASGTPLYTNPVSGEGIAQANEPPPFARDITVYKGYSFYSYTSTIQRLLLNVLTIEGIDNTSVLSITDNDTITTNYTFQGDYETFNFDFTSSVIADFYNPVSPVNPVDAKYITLASSERERKYYVWIYRSDNDVDPGTIPSLSGYVGIKVTLDGTETKAQAITKIAEAILAYTDDFNILTSSDEMMVSCSNNGYVSKNALGATVFTVVSTIANSTAVSDENGKGEDVANNKVFLPRIPTGAENGPTVSQQLEQLAKSLIRVVNAQDPLVAGYYQSSYTTLPGQMLFEGREIVGPIFYITSNVGTNFTPTLPINTSASQLVFSSNETRPNRVMYSKYQQPEAVPLANFIDIGPKDRAINRVIALRDSLFVLKEDGVYRLSGDQAPFTVTPFDSSVQVLAPDTAVVLNNQIYALSTQGVIVITDGGVEVISRPIEDKLLSILREGFNYRNISFGVSYESDRAYILFLPSNQTDEYATQQFRYNTFTRTWTRWNKQATCGLVNFGDNKMYLGAGDINSVEKERKSLTRDDYADREYITAIATDGVEGKTIEVDNLANIAVGDVIIQKQYLTIDQYNRLLHKLDDDMFVTDKTYIQDLELSEGANLRNALENLTTKLDNDPTLDLTTYSSLIAQYTNSVTSIVPVNATSTVINISGVNNFKIGRYVRFVNTNTIPSLNAGIYKVKAVSTNSITIETPIDIVYSSVGMTVTTAESSFADMQGCYNLITSQLNIDTGLNFTNYPVSKAQVDIECTVEAINSIQRVLTLSSPGAFLFGEITVYKAIDSIIVFNPQSFGDVSLDKQVREGSAIFENSNYSKFIVGYSTDKFPAFIDTEFTRPGNGDFGQFGWDNNNWGGIAAPIPLRTYVPLEKQRCRFMNVKLRHKRAREKYSLMGFSLTFRPYNTRTNR